MSIVTLIGLIATIIVFSMAIALYLRVERYKTRCISMMTAAHNDLISKAMVRAGIWKHIDAMMVSKMERIMTSKTTDPEIRKRAALFRMQILEMGKN